MISILTPSRGRPALAKRMYDSAKATAKKPETLQILFYLNEDDPFVEEYKKILPAHSLTIGPDQSTSYSWNNELLPKATNDIIFLAGDDVRFQTPDWDQTILNVFEQYEDKICMVVPWCGKPTDLKKELSDQPIINVPRGIKLGSPHFALHKNWIDTLGYFLPPWFWHWYVDTYNQKIANELGRLVFIPHTLVLAKKVFDDTGYRVRNFLNINKRDDYVWSKIQGRHLEADVHALKTFIDTFNLKKDL